MRPLIIALTLVCATAAAKESMPVPNVKTQQQEAAATSQANPAGDEAAKQAIADGWRHLKSGNAAVAIKLFNTAARLNPKDANAYWGMGAATAQQRKFGVAVELFERAGVLDPNNVRLAADAGLAYTRAATDSMSDLAERAKSLQKALAWFDKAEKLDPAYALTYANRAIALSYLGDYDQAWENISRAEAMDRSSLDPKLITYLSEKRPRPEKAQPAEQSENAAPVKAEPEPEKTLRVITGKPVGRKDRDVRHCLDLSTNEAIIRCVYPRR